ncbi:helix-turn-helix domain-containing protein [Geodermatophilus sp. URMC 65]
MSTSPPPTTVERLVGARALPASGEARRIRLAAGISLQQIAAEIGVSVSAIYRWERGDRMPRSHAAAEYGALLLRLRDILERQWQPAD